MKGEDRNKPQAIIRYDNGKEEKIDIIDTVKNSAISIGHPAVLHAIRRWERITLYRNALSGGGQYKTSNSSFAKIAAKHLENIGQALIKGAQERVYPKELTPLIRPVLGTDVDYLIAGKAWELLGEAEIQWKSYGEGVRKRRTDEDKLRRLEGKLRESLAGLISIQNARLLQLQIPLSLKLSLEAKLRYVAHWNHSGIRLRISEDHESSIAPKSKINIREYPDMQLWLKASNGKLEWVRMSEVIKQYLSSVNPASDTAELDDLIKGSSLRIPEYKLTERERKLIVASFSPSEIAFTGIENPQKLYSSEPLIDSLKTEKTKIVIAFLKSEEGRRLLTRRPKRQIFLTKFDSWRFGTKAETMRTYRKLARKNKGLDFGYPTLGGGLIPPEWLDGRFLMPDYFNEYELEEIKDSMSFPVATKHKDR